MALSARSKILTAEKDRNTVISKNDVFRYRNNHCNVIKTEQGNKNKQNAQQQNWNNPT